MKKIVILALLLAWPSFAFYFDIGMGLGYSDTEVNDVDVADVCSDACDHSIGGILGLRFAGPLNEKLWLGGEFGGFWDRYEENSEYMQFNHYYVAPSVIVYPVEHLHLSGSLGVSWTGNFYSEGSFNNGVGIATSLIVGYNVGTNNESGRFQCGSGNLRLCVCCSLCP